MPDNPAQARFLNDRTKYIALHRIKSNKTGVENKTVKWYQVREAFTDLRTWMLVVYCLCTNFANGGLSVFAAQVVSSFGYSALKTVLLGIPTGLFMTFTALCVAIPNLWLKNMRVKIGATFALIPLISTILVESEFKIPPIHAVPADDILAGDIELPTSNKNGRLVSYYCIYVYWAAYPTVVSLAMANTSGHTKKVTMNAILFFSYCLGNIIAPQVWHFFTLGENSIDI